MAGQWKSPSGVIKEEGLSFNEAGDWIYIPPNREPGSSFPFGAGGAASGDGGTVQLWGRLANKKLNLGASTAVTFADPVIWPDLVYLDGEIGITLSSLTGNGVVVGTGR